MAYPTEYGGDLWIARHIAGGGRTKMLFVQDSTLTDAGIFQRWMKWWRLPKVTGTWVTRPSLSFNQPANNAFLTSNLAVAKGGAGVLGGTQNYAASGTSSEAVFNGGTVPASDGGNTSQYGLFRHTMHRATVAPAAASPVESADSIVWKGDWIADAYARGATVKGQAYVLKHPAGENQNAFYLQLRGGTSTVAVPVTGVASPYSAHAVARTLAKESLVIPTWSFVQTQPYVLEARVKFGTVTTSGASHLTVATGFTTEETDGFEGMAISTGGEQVSTYVSTSNFAAATWADLATMGFNAAWIACSINSSPFAITQGWRDDLQTLINRVRTGIGPNGMLILVAQHNVGYGGLNPHQPSYNQALYDAALANSPCLFLNLYDTSGSIVSQYQNITQAWQSGNLYHPGDVVTSGGSMYAAKAQTSGTTAPGTRSTGRSTARRRRSASSRRRPARRRPRPPAWPPPRPRARRACSTTSAPARSRARAAAAGPGRPAGEFAAASARPASGARARCRSTTCSSRSRSTPRRRPTRCSGRSPARSASRSPGRGSSPRGSRSTPAWRTRWPDPHMAEFDAIFHCTYGGEAFQLKDYVLTSETTFGPGGKRTGTKVRVTGTGYVEATDAADLTAKLESIREAFQVDGADLVITGLGGGVQVEILAAQTTKSGPHVERFELGESAGWPALVKPVSFAIFADQPTLGTGGVPVDTYAVTTATRSDRLRQIGYAGELSGPDASAHFRTVVLPQRFALFGLVPPPGSTGGTGGTGGGGAGGGGTGPTPSSGQAGRWVPDYEDEVNDAGDVLRYRMTFTELEEAIPAAYLDAEIGVVDFEYTFSADRDDQMRLVETRQYDVLLTGNGYTLVRQLRPEPPIVVLRESVRHTSYRERRVQATFVTLAAGDGNDLLEWRQTVSYDRTEDPVFQAVEYEGLPPVLLRKIRPVQRARQSGRAVGLGKFPKAPPPVWGTANYAASPRVERNDLSNFEKETTWTYEYVFNGAVPRVELDLIDRPTPPASPGFDTQTV
jgi:hypothetical protein